MGVLLINPGHGGWEPGAVSGEIEEKDITLNVSLQLRDLLKDKHKVSMTREGDTYMSPSKILTMIRKTSPECFISIHCNSSTNSSACGIETIYRDDYDFPLASAIHRCLIANTELRDRGIKNDINVLKRRLKVLDDFETPACLVEIGFMSNEEELQFILENTSLIAQSIAEGVEEWSLIS